MKETFLVTGGAGFIGTNFVRMLAEDDVRIVVLDILSYAGNLASIADLVDSGRIEFVRGDIGDEKLTGELLERLRPDYIVNFAAESHVDRSVDDPRPFVLSNVEGSQVLIESARRLRNKEISQGIEPSLKKFVQISTDEVYGDLDIDHPQGIKGSDELRRALHRDEDVVLYGSESFREASPLKPSSPYSATKTAADLMALAYFHTFGMPVVVTRCSNNYGPYQFPEKLIPLMLNNMLENKALPVYGRGLNVRDWIHVDDHCRGVLLAAREGRPGQVYNLGGYCERRNIDIVHELINICAEEITSEPRYKAFAVNPDAINDSLITYVGDRPGHDRRYAIDAHKAMEEFGWYPEISFCDGIRQTVRWYLDNRKWVEDIVKGDYRDYYEKMYSGR